MTHPWQFTREQFLCRDITCIYPAWPYRWQDMAGKVTLSRTPEGLQRAIERTERQHRRCVQHAMLEGLPVPLSVIESHGLTPETQAA